MRTSVVIGMGYGDEGKGLTTSFLSAQHNNSLVVRFNGGHQAGHTAVSEDGVRHVFSNFGSGTLSGTHTYWSKYCTFYPLAVKNEYSALLKKGVIPTLFVDDLCPITTPFDKMFNRATESDNKHGSCGVGFGATLKRHEDYYKLHFQDLFFDEIFEAKMSNIVAYYKPFLPANWDVILERFMQDIKFVRGIVHSASKMNIHDYDHVIFEGAQGILLDMDFGFFPNVTRSNTTSKNAIELTRLFGLPQPEIYYITRSYLTRHGNGYMPNENIPVAIINNENETNTTNDWQGVFRKGAIDIDLLNYAIKCDSHFSKGCTKNLVISCLDQTGYDITTTLKGSQKNISAYQLPDYINCPFEDVFFSESPCGANIKRQPNFA